MLHIYIFYIFTKQIENFWNGRQGSLKTWFTLKAIEWVKKCKYKLFQKLRFFNLEKMIEIWNRKLIFKLNMQTNIKSTDSIFLIIAIRRLRRDDHIFDDRNYSLIIIVAKIQTKINRVSQTCDRHSNTVT